MSQPRETGIMRLLLIVPTLPCVMLLSDQNAAAYYHPGYGYGSWGYYYPHGLGVSRFYADNRWLQTMGAQQAAAEHQRLNELLLAQSMARAQAQELQSLETAAWWRNYLERETVSQHARPAPLAAPATQSVAGADPLIRWPSLLLQSAFADPRKRIEAPFRRALAGGSAVRAADYRSMVADAQQMIQQVLALRERVEPNEFTAVLRFLDQLASEAATRAAQASSTSAPP